MLSAFALQRRDLVLRSTFFGFAAVAHGFYYLFLFPTLWLRPKVDSPQTVVIISDPASLSMNQQVTSESFHQGQRCEPEILRHNMKTLFGENVNLAKH